MKPAVMAKSCLLVAIASCLFALTCTKGNFSCQLNNGGCSHICLLSSNGSECACPGHLTLREDGKNCYFKYDFQKFLLFADAYYSQSEIFLFSLDGTNLEAKPVPIDLSMYHPVALGLDIIENRIYWTDTRLDTISRVFINGSSPEVIVSDNVDNSYGLAVDPLGRNIYWTNTYTNKIEVSRLDGTMRKTLIDQDVDEPKDIILDINKGFMYWCEAGNGRKIEVANMDGDQRQILVRRGLYYPNGLTLDDTNNRLYWVDSFHDTLEYYDLQRHTITTLLDRNSILLYPFGLTFLDGLLYWTDCYRDAIFQANQTTPSNAKVLVNGLRNPMDIHAYDRNKTLPVHNCSVSYGGCSHLCLLRPNGGYRCSCPDGYSLSEDGKTCNNHTNDLERFILFADGYYSQAGIFLFSLDGSSSRPRQIQTDIYMYWPAALGFDIIENRIYWTDRWRNTISRVFINGSSAEVIVSDNVHDSYGLFVDPLGRNIYWTDFSANKIEVSRMDGTMRKTLIDQDLDEPRDIILDVDNGLIYWCEVGKKRKIEVANMDGDNRRTLVGRRLHYPNGLTLDVTKTRLYWVESWFHSLEYYDLERHTIITLLESSSVLLYPFGLTSLDDHLYWADQSINVIYQAKQTTPSNATVLVSGLRYPMDIHAYDRNTTLPVHNCSVSYGGCSHLCLLRPNGGYSCSCPDGYSLSEDGKTCNDHTSDLQKFLLFANGHNSQSGIFLISLNGSSSRLIPVPINISMNWPTTLGLDIVENRIYWTDSGLKTISRVFINGSSPEVIVSGNVFNSYGLAVDPLGRNIYWTDSYSDRIEVSRMDGTMRRTLIDQELEEPSDIILDLGKGLMYWINRGADHKIEVANMDGDNRRILVRRGLYYPYSLTIDEKNNWLYWVDSFLNTLEYYDLERHTITTLLDHSYILSYSFGLTLLGDYLYWTDQLSYAVYQADKRTASNPKVLVSRLSNPMDIHAYDRNEKLPDHPCSSSYGGCSHLCLLRPDGYNCSCPDHLQFSEVCSPSVVILPSSSTPVNTVWNSNYQSQSVSVISSSTSVLISSSSETYQSLSMSTSHMKEPLFSTLPSESRKTFISSSTSVLTSSSSKQFHLLSKSTSHMKTPLFLTPPSESCKTFIITSVLPSSTCDCSIYNPSIKTEQIVAISSMLPSSLIAANVSSTSASNSAHIPATQSEQQTTISSTLSSPSFKRSVSSSSAPTSIHNAQTQSGKKTTVLSTCKPPTSVVDTTCLPNTCKHGGTCVIPGNYCKCQKVFAWHDCSIYIGSSTVEIELIVSKESQWNLLDFKIAMATACTEFFCKTGECTSKSKSEKVKRSEGATYFQPSDIVIPGLSSDGEKIWQVKFAILFPTMDGQAPQPMLPVEIIQMANESKGTIEKVAGGIIKGITATSEVEKSKAPDQPKNGEHQQSLNKDKRTSMSNWIATGVGGLVVLLVVLVAFGIYRLKRKIRPHKRKIDIMPLGITHVNTEFQNPAFDEDSIYESMSRARGNIVAAGLAQENGNGLQELCFQDDTRNKIAFDDRTYQALVETAMTRSAYTTAQHNTCWEDHEIENLDIRCDSLHAKKVQDGKIDVLEKRYVALKQKKRHPRRGGESGDSEDEIPRNTSGTVTMKMATYMSWQCQDESGA